MEARLARPLAIAILLVASIGQLACEPEPPTEPSARSVAGTWTGTYRVIACRGGVQACFGLRDSYALRLELTQTDDGVTGDIVGDLPAGSINGAIAVTGSLDASETLHVGGRQDYVTGGINLPSQTGVVIDDWASVVAASGGSMSGRFHLTVQFRTNNAYPDVWNVDAELVTLTR